MAGGDPSRPAGRARGGVAASFGGSYDSPNRICVPPGDQTGPRSFQPGPRCDRVLLVNLAGVAAAVMPFLTLTVAYSFLAVAHFALPRPIPEDPS